jgi:hypothetical protein
MKKWIYLLIIAALFLLGSELVARYILGLGHTVVYRADPQYEYIYKQNQNIKRFGKIVLTNEYSMRSLPLAKNEKRVLLFGDSVLNGGSLTDHGELATTLLEKSLQKSCDTSVRILNISAGSWGPDNAFAYLEKYGDFNATEIILVFSSHDAHDSMNHEAVVDVHPSFPSKEPCCALVDGFSRYFIPKVESFFSKSDKKETVGKIHKIDNDEKFNSGWEDFLHYAKAHNMGLYVVLHPGKKEFEAGEYDENGKKIIEFLNTNKVPYLLELENTKKEYFRDDIHPNKKGQELLFHELLPVVQKKVCQNQPEKNLE